MQTVKKHTFSSIFHSPCLGKLYMFRFAFASKMFIIGVSGQKGECTLTILASIDKGTRGSAGRKCPHTASKPLRIHKVFSAAFSLSASISAPAELLRIGQPWIFEGFLFFWTQAGCRPPRTKGQKAPKRLAVRRVCSC